MFEPEPDFMMSNEQIAKSILSTRGVNSKVLVKSDGVQKLKTAGHILLADFDGVSKQEVLDRCMDLEGINILWASSSTGFHLWNLTVRSVDEIALLGLKLGSDCKHVAHGYKIGSWVLRIAPKFRENNTQYKPAPKLIHTWCNDSLRFQSVPHIKLFGALTGKRILAESAYKLQGLNAQREDYFTLTDKMKKGLSK